MDQLFIRFLYRINRALIPIKDIKINLKKKTSFAEERMSLKNFQNLWITQAKAVYHLR